MRGRLIPKDDGKPIELDKPMLLMGRSPSCDVQLSSRKISRLHCCLCILEEGLYVRDLDSTNGVRINGDKVTEGEFGPGDELVVGDLVYRVVLESGVAPPPEKQEEDPVAPVASDGPSALDSSGVGPPDGKGPGGSALDESAMAYEVSVDESKGAHGGESVMEVGDGDLLPLDSDDDGKAQQSEDDGLDLLADDDPFDLGKDSEPSRGSSEIPIR